MYVEEPSPKHYFVYGLYRQSFPSIHVYALPNGDLFCPGGSVVSPELRGKALQAVVDFQNTVLGA